MNQLTPSLAFKFAFNAYPSQKSSLDDLKLIVKMEIPEVDTTSLVKLNGVAGLFSNVHSGFGFAAKFKGSRSNELIIATRGTDIFSGSDVGTDVNTAVTLGPTGDFVHKGFQKTFTSYIRQLDAFVNPRTLGFRPTAIHCVGHSLGGALANLNAAAFAELGYNTYMYTLAAPRVGLNHYAEHLSRKLNHEHVYRVANESDPVAMVGCYPFVHAPTPMAPTC